MSQSHDNSTSPKASQTRTNCTLNANRAAPNSATHTKRTRMSVTLCDCISQGLCEALPKETGLVLAARSVMLLSVFSCSSADREAVAYVAKSASYGMFVVQVKGTSVCVLGTLCVFCIG
jgi:hypothetical protein